MELERGLLRFKLFLPTPSAGRATSQVDGLNTALEFLSTPSVRRATCQTDSSGGIQMNFYPRPPRGGRRIAIDCESVVHTISIHALREEGDSTTAWPASLSYYFYPRPPRGGRLDDPETGDLVHVISIHALREEGDRWLMVTLTVRNVISIHALREEGDRP